MKSFIQQIQVSCNETYKKDRQQKTNQFTLCVTLRHILTTANTAHTMTNQKWQLALQLLKVVGPSNKLSGVITTHLHDLRVMTYIMSRGTKVTHHDLQVMSQWN